MFDNLRHVFNFDDLLFEKRNRDYGAYQLRKRYNAVMFASIIIASIIFSSLVVVPFILTQRNDRILTGGGRYVQVSMDNYEPPVEQVFVPPAPMPPKSKPAQEIVKYVPPEVVDSIKPIENLLPTTDEALDQSDIDISEIPGNSPGDNIIPGEGGDGSEQPFFFVEVMPSFRGGDLNKFRQWVQMRTNYPQEAVEKKIKGRVYLTFIIEKDGSVSNVTIVKGVDPLIDNEAVKVIQSSPKWAPGLQRGHPVRVRYSISLYFAF
jgi:protein TonB